MKKRLPTHFVKLIFVMLISSSVVLSFNVPADSTANTDFNKQFDDGIQTAKKLQGKPLDSLKAYKPNEVIKNYSDHPNEANYINNPEAIKSAAEVAKQGEAGKAVEKSISEHPLFPGITPSSPEIQRIQKRGDDAMDAVINQFGDCVKQTSCTTTYTKKICEETPTSTYQYCKKTLNIDLVPHKVEQHHILTVRLSVKAHNYAGANVNAVTGQIVFVGPREARFSFDGRLPSDVDCHTLSGKIISRQGNATLDTIDYPGCHNGLVLAYHFSGGRSLDLTVDMTSTRTTYEPKDRWVDDCVGLSHSPLCVLQEERCVAGRSTHKINGIDGTRDCWEFESKYLCNPAGEIKTCQPLRDAGCEQTQSVCLKKTDTGCQLYEQTFQCPEKKCSETSMICNGETFCLRDDCVKTQKSADPDFQKAVSALTALNEAAKSLKNNMIFGGVKKSCDNTILGAANCCRNDGWLIDDLPLMKCSSEEKQLGKDKENGLGVYIGEYCENDVLGLCVMHRKSYCIFPSILARIVQEQGRDKQLHISFGDAERPNCRGLSPEELQRIDFGKIDFSAFYAEIARRKTFEDPGKLNQRIQDRMRELAKGK